MATSILHASYQEEPMLILAYMGPTGLGSGKPPGENNRTLKRIGRWAGLGIALSVVMGCQGWDSGRAVYVYEPWSKPTPSYADRDQRVRYEDYDNFYNLGGYASQE